jgi:hypothetical protein
MSRASSQIAKGGPSNDHNVLQPRGDNGYLAVQVFFHEEPVQDIEVVFKRLDGALAVSDVPKVLTDKDGLAKIEQPVSTGNYLCELGRPDHFKTVCTVESLEKPFIIVMPVGRPYFDIGGNWEFTRR